MQGLDEKIVLFFQSIRCEVLTVFFKLFIPLEFWYGVAIVLVVYYFLRTGVLRAPIISFLLVRYLSISTYGLKDFFHRPRPYLAIKGLVPLTPTNGFSFPAGHAVYAMALAVIFAFHFPKTRKPIFILAVLIGLSRVYLGVHYLSDVLAGFILGAVIGLTAVLLERAILALSQGVKLLKKPLMILLVVLAIAFHPTVSQAKDGDDQDQIILLNDSAAALEDTDPGLSKGLTKFADEKEKEWEGKNANKDQLPTPMTDQYKAQVQDQIKLLNAAALAMKPTYPLIAKGLIKMAKDLNRTIEIEE